MSLSPDIVRAFTPTGRLRASINTGNPILAAPDPASGLAKGVSVDLARGFAAGSASSWSCSCSIPPASRSTP